VPARGGDLEGALRVLLALHLGEVHVVQGPLLEQPRHVHGGRGELGSRIEEIRDLGERRRAEHPEPGHDARLGEVLARENQRLDPRGARGEGHRERPAHRPDRALQPQLPEHRHRVQALLRDLLRGGEDAERDRQVERRAVLTNIGRCEVDGDALQREGVARIGQRRANALAALFHGALRQPHGRERRQAVRDVGLHVHEVGVDAEDGGGADAREHGSSPPDERRHSRVHEAQRCQERASATSPNQRR
jgi:hypothetical protein